MKLIVSVTGDADRYQVLVNRIAEKVKRKADTVYKKQMENLLNELVEATPKWTGASAGEATGIELPRWHPAYKEGLTIGNEPGQSGWQLDVREHAYSEELVTFVIKNPMWHFYLKYIGIKTGFVQVIYDRNIQKIKERLGR